jgi:hypothetical protein
MRIMGALITAYLLFNYPPVGDTTVIRCVYLIALTHHCISAAFALIVLMGVGAALTLVDPKDYPESLKEALTEVNTVLKEA